MNNIYIPSYNRADLVRTYEYLGCGKIVVPKSQEKDYKKRYGNAVVSIPDEKDGNIAKKRNAIIDLIKEEQADGYGWIIDDDFTHLKRKKEKINLTSNETLEVFEEIYNIAKDGSFAYCGFDYSPDCMKLKDMTPFSLTKPFFQVVLTNVNDNLRYNEKLLIGEDLEMWFAKMNKHRRIFKQNQYLAVCYGEEGGKNSVIGYGMKELKKYNIMINEMYGKRLITWNKTRFEYKVPIKGA